MKKLFFLLAIGVFGLSSCTTPLDFSDYHSPTRVDDALNALHTTYPSLTQIVTIGNSVEGRPIKALKISSTPGVNDPGKGDVVIVGCHHAREWMSVEVPLYIAVQILSEYATNADVKADIDHLQIWIIPVLNVDGFQYTQTPANRYWRKNRRSNGDGTFGVDLNRNYSYRWATLSGSGGNPITSSDTYYGPSPFSESELVSIRDFMLGLGNVKAYFTYHSYGEWHMKPWSYSFGDAPGHETLHSIALRDISRIAGVHGISYREIFTLYNASGEATDYWWNERRVAPLTTEVRPFYDISLGLAGFSPAASEIVPTCEENYPAVKAIIHDAARSGVWIRDDAGDTGSEPSSGYPWESPDIWTVPAVLNQNATVDLHIRINNSTGSNMQGVTVEAYYTDPRITLEFPNPNATIIGSRVVNVPPTGSEIVIPWTTPVGTNIWGERHWCVGVVIKHEDDMPLTTIVSLSSNIACHNFNTTTIVEGDILNIAATNYLDVAAELIINVNRDELPADWKLELPAVQELQRDNKILPSTIRKSRLLKTQGILLEPGQTVKIPVKVHFNIVPEHEVLVRFRGDLLPLQTGKRTPLGNGYTYKVTAKKKR